MWKAAVAVLLLINMEIGVKGTVDETVGSVADRRKDTADAAQTGNTPASPSGSSVFLGKLLAVPMDGSHWVGMKAIIQEMGRRGHQVTVVIPEVSMRMGPGNYYDTLTYPVPYDRAAIDSMQSSIKDVMRKSAQSFVEKMKQRYAHFQRIRNLIHANAESLLFNSSLISHLAQQGFDAVLTDPIVPTGSLIARKLGVPAVNLLRGLPCSLDMVATRCPSPPSYVPRFFTGYTDKMSFKQRVFNTLVAAVESLICRLVYWHFEEINYQFLGEKVGVSELLSDSAIWLMRTDVILEFPRPLMPNMILVGGINCNLRSPLPVDLESWVSGEHGFVVFTLGSMVADLPEEITSIFLEAFRQIPQKVIWRYSGLVPDNVPDNVKLMDWVPQNDLLAHPGVRAFITHAGSHGLFEGLCHAVPMLMLPISGDQGDNAQKLASRGVGVVLDFHSVTTQSVLQSLNEIIHDARYKENVQKLSALHRDRPVDPLDLSVFWTEFVMRHKGAKHLRAAALDLNWFQHYCLDVLLLLAAVVLVVVILIGKCLNICCRKLIKKRKQD